MPSLPQSTSKQTLTVKNGFSIFNTDHFWVIESGEIDIFAVETNHGGGALHHVIRLCEGEAIFSLNSDQVPYNLIARISPETRLSVEKLSDYCELSAVSPDGKRLCSFITKWIGKLSHAHFVNVIPTKYQTISDSEMLVIGEDSTIIFPRNDVCWIEQIEGHSNCLGKSSFPIKPSVGLFPLSRSSWIEARPLSKIRSVDPVCFAICDDLIAGLTQYHILTHYYISTWLKSLNSSECWRLVRKADREAAILRRALTELASPLSPFKEEILPIAAPKINDLLSVCQMIGEELDVQFKLHPDLTSGKIVRDPIAAIARASGVNFRKVALSDEWWKHTEFPLLVEAASDGRPMALLSNHGKCSIYDPQINKTVRLNSQTAESLRPSAFMFYRALPSRPLKMLDIIAFGLRGCRQELLMIVLMGLLNGILSICLPVATGFIFDTLIPEARHNELFLICGFLLIVSIASGVIQLVQGFSVLRLEGKMDANIQSATWDRLLALPVAFYRNYSAGDLADRSLGITQIRNLLTSTALFSLLNALFSIFMIGLLLYYSRILAMVGLMLILVGFCFTSVAAYTQLKFNRQSWSLSGLLSGMVLEFITGITKLRISGAETRAFGLWVQSFVNQKKADQSASRISNVITVFNSMYPGLCLAILFIFYSNLKSDANAAVTTGQFLAFITAFSFLSSNTLTLGSSIISALGILPLYERISPIFLASPETDRSKMSPETLMGSIEVDRLCFRYRPDIPLALNEVSFKVEPGKFIALIGPSGCGKSTLLRLLIGFETPESGAIYYDGQDLAGLNAREIRQQIGVVLQSSALITGTILSNIIGTTSNLTVEDAWKAIEFAGLGEEIRKLPMGLYTHIREGGVGLSGGQRQRIIVARAIVGRPQILLLDEATSALDNTTQDMVISSLKTFESTRIVIAHRLSTIVDADQIIVMDKGKIIQVGTYIELMEQGAIFSDFMKYQLS